MASQYEKRKAKEKTETETTTVALTSKAYDIVFDEANRKYLRITVAYDLESGQARVVEVKDIADSQPVAIKKMTDVITRKVFKLPIE